MNSEMDINLILKILTNAASDEEKVFFEKWMRESSGNREYYQKINELWELSNKQYDSLLFHEAAAKEKIRLRILEKQIRIRKVNTRFWISAAASLLILLGLVFSYYSLRYQNYLVYTSKNQIREITLPDSSKVWLNKHSSLRAPKEFTGHQRKVFLTGEGFFEVVHNVQKPFRVKAGRAVAEDLGTSFDVKLNEKNGDVSVIVHSGSVAFYKTFSWQREIILKPNQKGQYITSGHEVIQSKNRNRNYLSWKTGILTFYDTPLDEVCRQLSDYFGKPVRSEVDNTGLVLTGSFQNESLEDILKTIEFTLDVHASVSSKEIILRN